MSRTFLFFLLSLLLFSILTVPALAAKRVALVIGNANYNNAPLKNPANDATDVAKMLKKLDFEVIRKTDAGHRTMLEAMDQFYRKLQQAEIGLFYYAGHGMQIDGSNYLIPIGARVANANDVKWEAVPAGRVLGKMEDAGNRLNIVILDACRDNPFRSYVRSGRKGLAFMDAPDGTIISYATAPGSVALDGTGRNGIYTANLLKNMNRKDLSVFELFNQTGLDVHGQTGGRQTPWMTNSPMEKYYLAGGSYVVEESQGKKQNTAYAKLKVSSEPSGAVVYVDEHSRGTTPLVVSDLSPGSIKVRVEKDGFEAEQKRVKVKAGRRASISFVLSQKQQGGWLTVSPDPADAGVRILNIGPAYSPGMKLAAGRYHVEVSKEGYETATRWLQLAEGDDLDVVIALQKRSETSVNLPQQAFWDNSGNSSSSAGKKNNFTDPTTGMEFVWVEGGCYQMGDTFGGDQKDEKPVHEVCVDGFYMGKYEVTQGQYQKITGANPSKFKKGSNYPVETVSWDDARDFIRKLNGRSGKNFRLPTEAEWEYAARSGGKKEKYAGSNNVDSVAWYRENSGRSPHPVGTKSPNGLGLYDMSGNLWEWCSDYYDKNYYKSSPRNNPQGPSSGSNRVFRGGSWNIRPSNVRAAIRNRDGAADRFVYMGFRLVSSGQ